MINVVRIKHSEVIDSTVDALSNLDKEIDKKTVVDVLDTYHSQQRKLLGDAASKLKVETSDESNRVVLSTPNYNILAKNPGIKKYRNPKTGEEFEKNVVVQVKIIPTSSFLTDVKDICEEYHNKNTQNIFKEVKKDLKKAA